MNLSQEVQGAISRTSGEIIKGVQGQLFNRGQDATGKQLRGYKWESYRQYKLTKNPADVTDLKDTGEFYKGFFVDVEADTFTIDSEDDKAGKLEGQYGSAIFGMQPETRGNYATGAFWRELKTRIEGKLKLKFV